MASIGSSVRKMNFGIEKCMDERNYVNSTIKTIINAPKLTKVMCSIYESELQIKQISTLAALEFSDIEICRQKLINCGLIKCRIKDGQKYYSLVNSKICDAVLNLHDELYKLIIKTECGFNKLEIK